MNTKIKCPVCDGRGEFSTHNGCRKCSNCDGHGDVERYALPADFGFLPSAVKKIKFNVGDRVAVYNNGEREVGRVFEIYDGRLKIKLDDGYPIVRPQQLRLLKKKDSRRRWILKGHPTMCASSYKHEPITGPELAMGETVEVVEVRKKK